MADSKLTIIINARDEAAKVLRGVSSELKNVGDTLNRLGTGMTVGITAPIVGIGTAITKMAMDAVESENLFDVSMKGMAASARQWSDETSKALKLNSYEVRRNLGVFNSMFTAMGIGDRASLDMSEGLTQLAYDMASFFNLQPQIAFEKIRAGIMGETEPLRQLGIVVNETTVKQWALNNGLIKGNQELSEGQKVLARYGLIMQQTSNAQGDLARTASSPANALRAIKAQLEEVAIAAGQTFLPEVSGALNWVSNEGVPNLAIGLQTAKESWVGMSDEARQQMITVAALFVAGGPLLMGLSVGYKAIVAMGAAFKTLKLAAVAEIAVVTGLLFNLVYQLDQIKQGKPVDFGAGVKAYTDTLGKVANDAVEFAGGVFSLEEALKALGGTGITVFDDIGKAMGRTKVDMPSQEDLFRAWDYSGKMGPASNADLIKNYEYIYDVVIRSTGAVQAQTPALEVARSAWDSVGGATQKAGKDMTGAAAAALSASSDIVAYLISIDPAAQMAASAVSGLKLTLIGLQDQQDALSDATQAAQNALAAMQEEVSRLSNQLSEAKSRLEGFANVRLPGMNLMDDQMFQVEQALKRIKLGELGGDVSGLQPTTAWAKQFAATLPKSTEELEKMLEVMRLQKSLRYDEQLKEIQKAAKGVPEEMPFAEALSQIAATKNEITGLEGSLAGAKAAVEGQQQAIKGLQQASQDLSRAMRDVQADLQLQEQKQGLVNKALEAAYQWFIDDRQKLVEMGGEAATQAGIVDEATRRLIELTRAYAQEEAAKAIEAISAALDAYRNARAEMALGLMGGNPAPPPAPVIEPPETEAESPFAASAFNSSGRAQGPSINVAINGPVYGVNKLEELVVAAVVKAERRGRL